MAEAPPSPLNAACRLEDFAGLAGWLEELAAPWVPGKEQRKQWEVAMAVRTFTEIVPRGPRRWALGVGAGTEPTTFWLTRHCEQVHATDLYAAAGAWQREAPSQMLLDPAGAFTAFPWNPRRLIVQHMDARELRYEDERFAFAYSSSSLEHVGDFADAARVLEEIARVLEPGGVLSLSTELLLVERSSASIGAGPPRIGNTLLFRPEDLEELVRRSGLVRADPPSYDVGAAPVVSFARAVRDIRRHGTIRELPHILLEHEGFVWTSVHLALRKVPRASAIPREQEGRMNRNMAPDAGSLAQPARQGGAIAPPADDNSVRSTG